MNLTTAGNQKTKKVRLRAYTVEELAHIYEVKARTVKRWLKPFKEIIGKKEGWTYTYKQVEIIFDKLGWPENDN